MLLQIVLVHVLAGVFAVVVLAAVLWPRRRRVLSWGKALPGTWRRKPDQYSSPLPDTAFDACQCGLCQAYRGDKDE